MAGMASSLFSTLKQNLRNVPEAGWAYLCVMTPAAGHTAWLAETICVNYNPSSKLQQEALEILPEVRSRHLVLRKIQQKNKSHPNRSLHIAISCSSRVGYAVRWRISSARQSMCRYDNHRILETSKCHLIQPPAELHTHQLHPPLHNLTPSTAQQVISAGWG